MEKFFFCDRGEDGRVTETEEDIIGFDVWEGCQYASRL